MQGWVNVTRREPFTIQFSCWTEAESECLLKLLHCMEAQITECTRPLLPPLSPDVSCLLRSAWHFAGCGPVSHALEVRKFTHRVSYKHFHLQSTLSSKILRWTGESKNPTLWHEILQKKIKNQCLDLDMTVQTSQLHPLFQTVKQWAWIAERLLWYL